MSGLPEEAKGAAARAVYESCPTADCAVVT